MDKVIKFFKEHLNKEIKIQKIHVFGWQFDYDYLLVPSVCDYLFEDFTRIENIAPTTNDNRPGNKKRKYYITIHDTGDTDQKHNAKFWSDTVKNEYWEQGKYACSFHYVVGNDGIYHNIPDDEVAWHAGDTTLYDYRLYESNIKGNNPYPKMNISNDGFYVIDNQKTIVRAPLGSENDILKEQDFNDQSILCKLIDGKYYIGETYYSKSYNVIANRGGNNNSIGIESCININTDIYLTWQKCAKLVAHLLLENDLTIDDIKQHHYFSGKNCPQTLRMNHLWEHFLNLVRTEAQVLEFLNEGYNFELKPITNNVLSNGRIINDNQLIKFIVIISKGNQKEEVEFTSSVVSKD